MVRDALRVLWTDTCTVTEYQEYVRDNKSTGHTEVDVLTDVPCKLSFERLQTVGQTESAAELVQATKLFIDNEITIKPGSKITVYRNGRTFEYSQSGDPGVFTNHQEIPLTPFEGYA